MAGHLCRSNPATGPTIQFQTRMLRARVLSSDALDQTSRSRSLFGRWLWRGGSTRSHPELGSENPLRGWYCRGHPVGEYGAAGLSFKRPLRSAMIGAGVWRFGNSPVFPGHRGCARSGRSRGAAEKNAEERRNHDQSPPLRARNTGDSLKHRQRRHTEETEYNGGNGDCDEVLRFLRCTPLPPCDAVDDAG